LYVFGPVNVQFEFRPHTFGCVTHTLMGKQSAPLALDVPGRQVQVLVAGPVYWQAEFRPQFPLFARHRLMGSQLAPGGGGEWTCAIVKEERMKKKVKTGKRKGRPCTRTVRGCVASLASAAAGSRACELTVGVCTTVTVVCVAVVNRNAVGAWRWTWKKWLCAWVRDRKGDMDEQ
jgi:hypothetical protein